MKWQTSHNQQSREKVILGTSKCNEPAALCFSYRLKKFQDTFNVISWAALYSSFLRTSRTKCIFLYLLLSILKAHIWTICALSLFAICSASVEVKRSFLGVITEWAPWAVVRSRMTYAEGYVSCGCRKGACEALFPCGFLRKPKGVKGTCLPHSLALNARWLFRTVEDHSRIHRSSGRFCHLDSNYQLQTGTQFQFCIKVAIFS